MQPHLRRMHRLLCVLSIALSACAPVSAAPPAPDVRPAASSVPAPVAPVPAAPRVASFQELATDNPNIRQQYDTWRDLRAHNGEDPTDYQAFRQHLLALGAPDPGEEEIADFAGPSDSAHMP